MTEQELNRKIHGAFSRATPDVLDNIRSQCNAQKGTVVPMKQPNQNKNPVRRFGALAAALALVIALGAGAGLWQSGHAVASTVSLDVNPSIEIKVNKNEKVLSVTPLNEDGKTVIGDMDFARSDLDVTINALIGSMLRNGYLNELANSILISVDDNNTARGKALETRLAEEVDALLRTGTFSGSVLSQTLSTSSDLDALAGEHGITTGKAHLVQQIVTQNANYTFEALASLSINELNLISESGSLHLDEVNSTGTASDKAYIGIDAAKSAALTYFNGQIPSESQPRWEWELDFEHGCMVYELEASYTDGTEFECDVDALTGQVISGHHEHKGSSHHQNAHHSSSGNSPAPSPSPAAAPSPTPSVSSSPASSSPSVIGVDAAKAAALAHAKINASDTYAWECELDRDDGRTIYEIEFKVGRYEYSYEVDAYSGAILDFEKEYDD